MCSHFVQFLKISSNGIIDKVELHPILYQIPEHYLHKSNRIMIVNYSTIVVVINVFVGRPVFCHVSVLRHCSRLRPVER